MFFHYVIASIRCHKKDYVMIRARGLKVCYFPLPPKDMKMFIQYGFFSQPWQGNRGALISPNFDRIFSVISVHIFKKFYHLLLMTKFWLVILRKPNTPKQSIPFKNCRWQCMAIQTNPVKHDESHYLFSEDFFKAKATFIQFVSHFFDIVQDIIIIQDSIEGVTMLWEKFSYMLVEGVMLKRWKERSDYKG